MRKDDVDGEVFIYDWLALLIVLFSSVAYLWIARLKLEQTAVTGLSVDSVYLVRLTAYESQLTTLLMILACTSVLLLLACHYRVVQIRKEFRCRESEIRADSNTRFQSLFDAAPDPLIVSNSSGLVVLANEQVERLLGYDKTELVGKSVESLIPDRYRANHAAMRSGYSEKPSARRMGEGLIVTALRKDGTECKVEVSLNRFDTTDGRFVASALRDVSERIRIDEQLRIAAVAFESHHGVVVTDANDVILRVNSAFSLMTGYPADEVIGLPMNILKSGQHDAEFYQEMWKTITLTGTWEGEIWNRSKGGECFPHHVSIAEVKDKSGAVSHYIGTYTDITDRMRAVEDMKRKNSELSTIVDNFPGALTLVDSNLRLISYNERYKSMMRYPESLFSKGATNLEDVIRYGAQRGDYGDGCVEEIVRHRMCEERKFLAQKFERSFSDGSIVEVQRIPLLGGGVLSTYIDVTERRKAELDLNIASVTFESREAMVVTDVNAVILRVNRAFTTLTGYSADEVIGKTPRILKSNRHNSNFYKEMWNTIETTGTWCGEIWDRRKNGEEYPKWLNISAIRGSTGAVTHYVGTHYDITEIKKAEEKIKELAFFDQLTGLPNRTLLLDRLKQVMSIGERDENYCSLLFIDLDHFKTLNDTLGHDMGDMLLKHVALRLSSCVREADTVARFGGDEFVILLVGLGQDQVDAAASTETIALKILNALGQPFSFCSVSHVSTASLGATVFKGQKTSIDELLKQVDLAMYRAKDAGRNALRFFDPTMELIVKERVAMEEDLRAAIELKQFHLHYQAQVEGNNHVIGAEALLRWRHPTKGAIAPGDFIHLAEETGLILPIGHWVIESACSQIAAWSKRNETKHLSIAVNVSANQIGQGDFVDQVINLLHTTNANPCRLKLELTESILISDVESIIFKMSQLKEIGVRFSLDDFGTGYSSLSYLKRLPLEQLKIDKSFVNDILSDPNDAAISKTIVALAHSLGLGVIAEGVETEQQREFLANVGCSSCQGYLFSVPLPIDEFENFVQRSFNSELNHSCGFDLSNN